MEPNIKQSKVVQSQHAYVGNTELKPPSEQITSSMSYHQICSSTSHQSVCALSSLLSKSTSTPIVCTSKSSVVPSPVAPHSNYPSQSASVILSSSLSQPTSIPIVCTSKLSVVPSPHINGLLQLATVTAFSAPATFVAGTKGTLNLPTDLQSLLPRNYSYHLEVYENMPKGDFLGAPAECFRAMFYTKLENEEATCNWIADFQQTTQTTY